MGTYKYKAPKTGLCDHKKLIPEITEDGINDLYCLIDIVKNTHYLYIHDPELIEDMEGAAMLKMLEFIKSGYFDPSKGCLKNILYTCARNEMKNCIYRSSRDFAVEDEVMAINESPDIQVTTTAIEIEECHYGRNRMTDEMKEKVKANLNYIGFITDSDAMEKGDGDVDRWSAMVVWRKLRK